MIPRPSPSPQGFYGNRNNTLSQTGTVLRARQGTQVPGQGKKKKKQRNGPQMRMYRHLTRADHVVRVLRNFATVSSNGSGVIALVSNSTSTVTSSTDWANISQEFANYRVRKMRLRMFPATTSATSVTGPYQSVLMVCRWWGLSPTGESTLRQDDTSEFHSTLEEFVMETNFAGYAEGQEWIPVGTTLPYVYGFAYDTPTGAAVLALSSVVFTKVVEFEVEFLNSA